MKLTKKDLTYFYVVQHDRRGIYTGRDGRKHLFKHIHRHSIHAMRFLTPLFAKNLASEVKEAYVVKVSKSKGEIYYEVMED